MSIVTSVFPDTIETDEDDIQLSLAWLQHEAEQERHRAHLAVKSRIKHCGKPAPTKRKGLGALRLQRRIRNLTRTEQFAERDDIVTEAADPRDIENNFVLAEMERERELSIQLFDHDPVIIALDDDALEYYGDGFHVTDEKRDRLILS